jgi:hypothetical protein
MSPPFLSKGRSVNSVEVYRYRSTNLMRGNRCLLHGGNSPKSMVDTERCRGKTNGKADDQLGGDITVDRCRVVEVSGPYDGIDEEDDISYECPEDVDERA